MVHGANEILANGWFYLLIKGRNRQPVLFDFGFKDGSGVPDGDGPETADVEVPDVTDGDESGATDGDGSDPTDGEVSDGTD